MKKNLFRFLCILLLPLLTLSCNPLIDSLLTKENQSGKCIVSGSIVNTLDSNDARAAASVKRSTEKYFYKISCECTEPSETFTKIVDTNTFSLSLDPGTWTFRVTGYLVSSKEEITDTSVPVLVTTTPQTKTISQNVTLDNFNLSLNTGKSANISLKVDVSGTAIKSCKMTLTSLTVSATTYNKTFTPDNTGIISLEDAVSSGYYSMTLDFYDNTGAAGTLLYTARERLTVYPGATTLETDPYFVKWSYSNNKLVISNDTINNKSNHNVYVKSDASSNGTKGTKFDPFKTLSDAYNYINSVNNGTDNNYSIILMNDFTASDSTDPLLSIAPAKSLNLEICSDSTNNYKIENTGSKSCIKITGSSTVNVTLNNITITGATPGTTGAASDATGVYINNSSATLQIEGNTTVSSIGLGTDNPVQILTPVDSSTSFMLIPSSYTEGKVVLEGSGVSTIYGNVTVRDESVEGGSKKQWSVGSDGKLCKPVKNAYLSKLNFVPNKSSSNDEDKTVYVKTPADLKALADFVNTGTNADSTVTLTDQTFDGITIIQEDDISLSEYSNWEPIGNYVSSSRTTNYFKGTYDGGGKKITGLKIETNIDNAPGFFGNVDGSAEIKNIIISGSITCSAVTDVGGIVSLLNGGTIHDCESNISIDYTTTNTNYFVGGIVGKLNAKCSVYNCVNKGNITCTNSYYAAGIVGYTRIYQATGICSIYNCINEGTIKSSSSDGKKIGGIVAEIGNMTNLHNCLNKGEISGDSKNKGDAGGIVGYIIGSSAPTIYNCVNTGNVSGCAENYEICGNSSYSSSSGIISNNYYSGSNSPYCSGSDSNVTKKDCYNFTFSTSDGTLSTQVSGSNSLLTALNSWVSTNNTGSDLVYKNWAYDNTNGLHFAETASGGDDTDKTYISSLSSAPASGTTVYAKEASDLIKLATWVNGGNSLEGVTIEQTDLIDLSGESALSIGINSSFPFKGTYDGKNHKITNLSANVTGDYALFTRTRNATLKNIDISGLITDNATTGSSYIGGLVAYSEGGEITGCKVNVTITSSCKYAKVGGIVAYFNTSPTKIDNCINTGTITLSGGESTAGGILGYFSLASQVVIRNTVNNGVIKYTGSSGKNVYLGGIIGNPGTNTGGSFLIENCANKGEISSSETTSGSQLGGIVGYESNSKSDNTITNCFNIAKISGGKVNAGIIGSDATKATITYCYWYKIVCQYWTSGKDDNVPENKIYSTNSEQGYNVSFAFPKKDDESQDVQVYFVKAALNEWISRQSDSTLYKQWSVKSGTVGSGDAEAGAGEPILPIEN